MKVPVQLEAVFAGYALENHLSTYRHEGAIAMDSDKVDDSTVSLVRKDGDNLALAYYLYTDFAGELTFSEHTSPEVLVDYLNDWRNGDTFKDGDN